MQNFSIILKSQLEGAMRIDAEYYHSEFLKMADKLSSLKSKLLSEVAIIRSGVTPAERDDEQKDGVILLKTTDIRNSILLEKNIYYFISHEIDKKMKQTRLISGDTLVNIVGATLDVIGRTAFVPSDFPEANITQAMALVRSIDSSFLPEYIFVFLASKIGRSQSDRIARPTGQYNLNLAELGSFKIPLMEIKKQQEIKKIIDNFYFELNNSQNKYLDAEDILLEALGLENFNNEERLSSIINLSEIEIAGRMDAEYFQPKYEIIEDRVAKYNVQKLGDLVLMKKGIEVGAEEYQEEGKVFIRVSSMTKFGIVESDQKCLSEKLYEKLKADFQPNKGEILLTKDATPGVAYALKENIEGIVSGGTLRLQMKDKKVEAEYLALCLNSVIGQMQAERDAGGSVIAHWKPAQIKNVLIPILPIETQKKISELVIAAHEARKKSKELLEEAKRKVEEMIEKGGGEK